MLYKVLVNGKSCHGGSDKYIWALPSMINNIWTPGEWNVFDGKMVICVSGLHVTEQPSLWWKDGCMVYEVEVDGELGGKDEEKSKFVYSRVRLLRQVKMINIAGGWKIEQNESKSSGWSDPIKE
jgi:hypothetical protein